MRIRTIKPEFWMHEGLSQCAEFSRLLAIALLNWADDDGYFMAHHALLRGSLFPFEEDSTKIRRGLDELSKVGWIEVGEDKQGRPVGRVINFAKHQKVDRPKSSVIKGLCKFDDGSTTDRRAIAEASSEEGNGREWKGSIGEASATQEMDFKIPISDKPRKPDAVQQPKAKRPPDECFETLVALQGSSLSSLTTSERGRINKALSEIRSACPNLSAEQLRRRADAYREAMPGATLTATALAAHWSRLAGSEPADLTEKKLGGAARHFDRATVAAAPGRWEAAFEDLYDLPPDGEWHQQQPYVREAIEAYLRETSAPSSAA